MKKRNKGFTLIEMLVVVLIIGILAAIALPQYRMAVMKARVATILPMLKATKNAFMEHKLITGEYYDPDEGMIDLRDWDLFSSGDWRSDNGCEWENDNWYCFPNEEGTGYVYCDYWEKLWGAGGSLFSIYMYQPDDPFEDFRDMTICHANNTKGHRVCKALGGTPISGHDNSYRL